MGTDQGLYGKYSRYEPTQELDTCLYLHFQVAAEHSPSIIFIDEIDAIGTKRYESTSGGEREIQRTMLELLNQLDGFDDRGDVKVIMATNKIETLDPALIRPGRIDRKILFENPDRTPLLTQIL